MDSVTIVILSIFAASGALYLHVADAEDTIPDPYFWRCYGICKAYLRGNDNDTQECLTPREQWANNKAPVTPQNRLCRTSYCAASVTWVQTSSGLRQQVSRACGKRYMYGMAEDEALWALWEKFGDPEIPYACEKLVGPNGKSGVRCICKKQALCNRMKGEYLARAISQVLRTAPPPPGSVALHLPQMKWCATVNCTCPSKAPSSTTRSPFTENNVWLRPAAHSDP